MGHSALVRAEGGRTVKMGRWEVEEMGGVGLDAGAERGCGGSGAAMAAAEEGEERETVLLGRIVGFVGLFFSGFVEGSGCEAGRPVTSGGERSSPSVTLRESWRAKSEAYHHSRNLRAKMEVGRRSLRAGRRREYMAEKVAGFQMLVDCPRRRPR